MRAIVWISGASGGIGKALVETVPFDDARVSLRKLDEAKDS